MRRWSGLLVGALVMVGCATAPAVAPSGDGPPPEDATAYYPFQSGWRWAYNVEHEGDTVLATTSVLERSGDTAIVQSGDQRLSYAVSAEGIARREGLRQTDFLLRTPIRAGASWPLEGGEAKVASVGKVITVPGGTFTNCMTVEENRTNPQRVTRTSYCAGIGPVAIEVQVHDPIGGLFKTEMRASLLGVTRPGQDPLGPPEGHAGPPPLR
jgi:hypothetical protein